MTEPLLELRGLAVDFATDDGTVHAVDGLDLALGRGRTLGLVGESGCGKSVTSLAIMGCCRRRIRRSAARSCSRGAIC